MCCLFVVFVVVHGDGEDVAAVVQQVLLLLFSSVVGEDIAAVVQQILLLLFSSVVVGEDIAVLVHGDGEDIAGVGLIVALARRGTTGWRNT